MPKHGGPDGQGLPQQAFDELLKIFSNPEVSDQDAQASMMLSFSASRQHEWNEQFRPELIKLCIDSAPK